MTRHRGLTALAAACALAVPAVVLAQEPQAPPYSVPPAPAAPPPEPAAPVRPDAGRTAVIRRVSGLVKYRHRDASTFRRLRQPTKIPFGSEVDTRGGRVRLTVRRTADAPRESAIFYGGRFRIRQDPRVTTLRIRGGSFAETCPEDDVATTSRRRRRSVRHLWGSGRGRFRTRGRYSAATVRGTTWLVEDLCDGTRTVVERGEVEVEDFTVPDTPPDSDRGPEGGGDEGAVAPQAMGAPSKPRRVRVRRGGSYVAGPGR